ncbi:MAG: hypothetical protein JNJ69_13085 [Leptospiraceae bacterium]|nr:hypothetical protein [Leptospiraceae bacterium]
MNIALSRHYENARDGKEVAFLKNYFAVLPTVAAGKDLWLQAGALSHSVKAYSRGVGLFDMAIVVAARQTQALLWSKDKKLLSILKKEEIFHAKK